MQRPGLVGRLFGGALLTTFAVGIYLNFGLYDVLTGGDGLLANAPGMSMQIGFIGLATLASGVVSIAAAAMLASALGEAYPWMTRTYLALVTAGLAMSLVEYASLSAYRELAEAATAQSGTELATSVLRGLRNGVHFIDKLLGGCNVALMFTLLLRGRLLPAWLAWPGIIAAAVQMVGVGHGVLGYDVPMQALAPLALVYLVTLVWLLVRGFPKAGEGK